MSRLKSLTIATQISITSIFLVILTILISGGLLIYFGFQAQLAELGQTQTARSRAVVSEISAYVDDLQRNLTYLARVQGLVDMDPATQNQLLTGLLRHNSAYEILVILDNQGQVLSEVTATGEVFLADQETNTAFSYAYSNQEFFVSSVAFNADHQIPQVAMAVPIRNLDNDVDGILLAKINIQFLWRVLSRTSIGQSGYAYILDRSRLLFAQTGQSLQTFELRDISDLPYLQPLLQDEIDPLTSYRGLHGDLVIGIAAFIPSADWTLIIELPTAEVYAPVYGRLRIMLLTLAFSVCVAILLSYWLSRRITLPLQSLTQATSEIGAGNLEVRVVMRQDNELGILANTVNSMAAQLQRTIAALSQSEEHHRALLSAVPDMIFRNKRDGEFLDYHTNDLSKLLLPESEIIGRKSSDILPHHLAEKHLKALETALETGQEQVYEYNLTMNEELRYFEARSVASSKDEVLTIVRDITELRQFEKERIELLLEKERMQILSDFITQASHEFKTPISVVNMNLYMLKKNVDPQQAQRLEKIETQLLAIDTLVDSLTLMAKIDSGLYIMNDDEIDINEMLNLVQTYAQPMVVHKNLTLKIQFLEKPLVVCGNLDHLIKATQNLVDNAIAFTDEGGVIKLCASEDNGKINIIVSDTGCGIHAETLPYIFDRFFRSDKSGKTRGFGLGLPIARAIAEHHGGTIKVESTVEQCSTFSLILPLDNPNC